MLSFAIRTGLVCLLFVASGADAQTDGNMLRGIKEARVAIEDLNDASRECGISKDGIKSAVMFPSSSSDLIIVEDSINIIYITINVTTLNIICIANVNFTLYTLQDVILESTGREIHSLIHIWNNNSVTTSEKSVFKRHITDILEGYTKKLLTDWNLDNK